MKLFFSFLTMVLLLAACGGNGNGYETGYHADDAPAATAPPADDVPVVLTLTAPGAGFDFNDPAPPRFREVSVHDPSVFRAGGYFYVIGSHMAMARSADLIEWVQVAAYVSDDNPLIYNMADFEEALTFARTTTFWAGDIRPMPDGRFFMYYCTCEGSMPLSAMGLAIADHPEGPFMNAGIFLRSMGPNPSADGTNFNANYHPNAIDPHVFWDSQGDLWMVYGSFSGGIFIMRMDAATGFPYPGQGFGTRLMGNYHARIEGPYMLFSQSTGYYYLFVTFGGLYRTDGYNMRIARARHPEGPFYDARGNPMLEVRGTPGRIFDDDAIAPYGTKIMGGYWFRQERGERATTRYLSPGHNSAYFCADSGRYFLFFHTRFFHNHYHQVRVHEMWLNEDGWFVVNPFRYDGGLPRSFAAEHVPGSWKLINHGQTINTTSIASETVNFAADGTIYGAHNGYWELAADGTTFNVTLNGTRFNGRLTRSYAADQGRWVMSFTAMCADGIALWGAGVAID